MGVFLHHWDFVPAHLGAVEVDRGQNPEIHALGGLAFLFQLCPRFAQWPSFLCRSAYETQCLYSAFESAEVHRKLRGNL